MPHYAANLSFLFTDLPFIDRFAAARDAGFEAVEFAWPSASDRGERSFAQLGSHVRASGVAVALFNLAGLDAAAGLHGFAGVPGKREAFRASLEDGIALAREVGCRKVHALAGDAVPGADRETQIALLVENLTQASEEAAASDLTLCVETLNPVDFPGYLVAGLVAAIDVVRRVGRPNVRYQYDAYHLAMIGEDPVEVARSHGPLIGHVQFADCPGRGQPGTGRTDFAVILDALDEAGYSDWIGLEYRPTDPASRDFRFVEQLLRGRLGRGA